MLPGTATKNFTASLCPWNDSCACAIEQYGMKLPGVTLSPLLSLYTLITLPGRFEWLPVVTGCLLPVIKQRKEKKMIVFQTILNNK